MGKDVLQQELDSSGNRDERSISSIEVPCRFDLEEFANHLRTNYEIVDLDYAEKQAKVLMEHIQELKMQKTNVTVIWFIPRCTFVKNML